MKTINNIKINWLTIFGSVVIFSGLLFAVWLVSDKFFPVRQQALTVESYKEMNKERYAYEDSLFAAREQRMSDSLNKFLLQKRTTDSAYSYFYNITNQIYEDKINNANYLSTNDIIREWERRYPDR